jgi:hypothetical protein
VIVTDTALVKDSRARVEESLLIDHPIERGRTVENHPLFLIAQAGDCRLLALYLLIANRFDAGQAGE